MLIVCNQKMTKKYVIITQFGSWEKASGCKTCQICKWSVITSIRYKNYTKMIRVKVFTFAIRYGFNAGIKKLTDIVWTYSKLKNSKDYFSREN